MFPSRAIHRTCESSPNICGLKLRSVVYWVYQDDKLTLHKYPVRTELPYRLPLHIFNHKEIEGFGLLVDYAFLLV